MKKQPYTVIKSLYVTEKTAMLQNLKNAESNKCLKKCKSPKYAFLVDVKANKIEIVNTIRVKPKQRRVRGKVGFTNSFKKAIVTLSEGDDLGDKS